MTLGNADQKALASTTKPVSRMLLAILRSDVHKVQVGTCIREQYVPWQCLHIVSHRFDTEMLSLTHSKPTHLEKVRRILRSLTFSIRNHSLLPQDEILDVLKAGQWNWFEELGREGSGFKLCGI